MCDVRNMARLSWPIPDINMRRPEYGQFKLALFGTSMCDFTPTLLLFHAWFPISLINFVQLSRTSNLIHAPVQLRLGRVSIHTLGQLFLQTSVRPKVGQIHIFFFISNSSSLKLLIKVPKISVQNVV